MDIKSMYESITGIVAENTKKLEGGVTNDSFLVETSSGNFILRVPGMGTNEYINRSWEKSNIKLASQLGFAPEVVYSNPVNGIIITKYLEDNIPMTVRDIYIPERLKLMCDILVRLHSSDLIFASEFDLIKMKETYLKVLKRMKIQLPKQLCDNMDILEQATEMLLTKYPKELVPCHGDPKLNNFLLQGNKIWLIDWEYSGMADRYFDLVNMAMTNNLSDEEEKTILQMYERYAGISINPEKYLLYKVATDYMWLFWHLIKFFQNEMVEYNDASWKKRLHRALNNLKLLEENK